MDIKYNITKIALSIPMNLSNFCFGLIWIVMRIVQVINIAIKALKICI